MSLKRKMTSNMYKIHGVIHEAHHIVIDYMRTCSTCRKLHVHTEHVVNYNVQVVHVVDEMYM